MSECANHPVAPIDMIGRETIHDLRNLFWILASARHLLEVGLPIAHRALLLEALESAAMKGWRLTPRLLGDLSRAAQPIDVDQQVAALEPVIRALADDQVDLSFDLAAGCTAIKVDPVTLDAVLLELVTNARSAIGSEGSIILRTRRYGQRVWLTVGDNGCGMAAWPLSESNRRTGARGTGLRCLERFVQSAHGRLHVRSRPRFGTIVTISLPSVLRLVVPRSVWPSFEKLRRDDRRQPLAA